MCNRCIHAFDNSVNATFALRLSLLARTGIPSTIGCLSKQMKMRLFCLGFLLIDSKILSYILLVFILSFSFILSSVADLIFLLLLLLLLTFYLQIYKSQFHSIRFAERVQLNAIITFVQFDFFFEW